MAKFQHVPQLEAPGSGLPPLELLIGKERVLIKRITGIEDSSRFWSVYMVLDHLLIVDRLTIKIMESLSRERGH